MEDLLSIPLLWIGFEWNIIKRVPVDFSKLTCDLAGPTLSQFVINVFFFILTVFILTTSVSLFWDLVFKASGNPKIMKSNLKTRLRNLLF